MQMKGKSLALYININLDQQLAIKMDARSIKDNRIILHRTVRSEVTGSAACTRTL